MGYRKGMLCAMAIVTALGNSAARAGAPVQRPAVEQQLERLAQGAGGVLGVAAVQIETGRRVAFNGSERFPMASVYKVAIALAVLNRVDRGELKLDAPVALGEHDYRPGHSPLAELAGGAPVTMPAGRLLELMLLESDNTASDAMMRLAGGPDAVTARLREAGIREINVNRPEARLMLDYAGVKNQPPESEWTAAQLEELWNQASDSERAAAAERYNADPRDTATPEAMIDLLSRAYRGELLSPASTEHLLRLMTACRTGPARLKGGLPAGTVVAHKTGSMGGTTNDVGIITLPDGTHVAIAIFVKASPNAFEDRERAMAEISRTVYDYFLLAR